MGCLLGRGGEQKAKALEAALQVAFYGSHRGVEGTGDFFGGEVLLIAEEKGGAMGVGQAGEQGFEFGREAVGVLRGVGFNLGVVFFQLYPEAGIPAGLAGVAAAEGVGGAMDGDLTEPEAGVVGREDAVEVAVEFEEDVLGDFLGEAGVAGHAQGEREDHGLVGGDEGFKVGLPGGDGLGGRLGGGVGGPGGPGDDLPEWEGECHRCLLSIPRGKAGEDAEGTQKVGEMFAGGD